LPSGQNVNGTHLHVVRPLLLRDLLVSAALAICVSPAALCDYKGYRAAIASGNLAKYHASINSGALGDVSHCRAPARDIADSLRSFPSGHSAISWSGMVYASLYLRAAFGVPAGVSISIPSIFSMMPLLL
jgi:membrane-associated phospholipid phosphatase